MQNSNRIGRRGFLGASAATGGAAAAAGLFQSLVARRARALTAQSCTTNAYGPLKVAEAENNGVEALLGGTPVLMLPQDFKFAVVSVSDRQNTLEGGPVPHAFDGMCAVPGPSGGIRLIRNHEDRDSGINFKNHLAPVLATRGPRGAAYDQYAGGGCTVVDLSLSNRGVPNLVSQHWGLVGTVVNCAGGVTPWNTWITCEEDVRSAGSSTTYAQTQHHGYCFEVSNTTSAGSPSPAVPLTGLGRMQHEAVAIDPSTGMVYQTEDAGSSSSPSGDAGFYRWEPPAGLKPVKYRDLEAMHEQGALKMLKVIGVTNERLYEDTTVGKTYQCEWVPIPNRNPEPVTSSTRLLAQGKAAGGAIFKKLEGCWYDPKTKKVFFVASGDAGHGLGQVWSYDTVSSELELVYAPDDLLVTDNPDNICVSPRGGLVLCEDSAGAQFLRGLTTDGRVFDLARNVFSGHEFAGACFYSAASGMDYLFVNIMGLLNYRQFATYKILDQRNPPRLVGPDQGELALTVAIWGPWSKGCL